MKKLNLLIFSLFFLLLASEALAVGAFLYLSPTNTTHVVGDVFNVSVRVNTAWESINAVEGQLSFNQSELQVLSLSKTGSIFSLWAEEPSFSNQTGLINFGGGTITPVNQTEGMILSIAFQAKKNATSKVSFLSGSILLADGMGTDILSAMNDGTYILFEKQTKSVVPTVSISASIESTTHPDQNKWYSNNSPEFSWDVPVGATYQKLSLNEKAYSAPAFFYKTYISDKKIENLVDGVWYFHLQFSNQSGWGDVTHRKVMIDTKKPEEFDLIIDNNGDETNPNLTLYFETTDSLSGISHYEIKIKNEDKEEAISTESGTIEIELLGYGQNQITVKAFDQAGNSTEKIGLIVSEPLNAPLVTSVQEEIEERESLTIQGSSEYNDAEILIFIKKINEDYIIKGSANMNKEGSFTFIHKEGLLEGEYEIWAQVRNKKGALSATIEKYPFLVVSSFNSYRWSFIILEVLILVALIILGIWLFKRRKRKIVPKKKIVKGKKVVTQQDLSESLLDLEIKSVLRKQVDILSEGGRLTKREKVIKEDLEKLLELFGEDI